MNPILPVNHFVPDSEAHVWKDGRLYIYGSYDNCGDNMYCSPFYHVFSTDDLVHWIDHGESFDAMTVTPDAEEWQFNLLYAPDCAYANDLYYLFFCQSGGGEGVAVSKNPYGPFNDVSMFDADGIDPTVLVDDDGEIYYFWGQFSLNGAKLTPDLRTIDKASICHDLLTEAEHGFHEGSSICKYNGKYYMLFADISRGKATCLSYAISDKPLGPYKKCGVVIDNDGCDPQTWNNHGSLCEFNGNWYVFYHRSSQNSNFNRRACIEPIHFDENGLIAEVEMTTQGVEPPICATRTIPAGSACELHGKIYVGHADVASAHSEFLCDTHYNDYAGYKYVDFGSHMVSMFTMRVACPTFDGKVDLHIDAPDGPLIGTCEYYKCDTGWADWKEYSCPIEEIEGKHALYLKFTGRYYGRQANLIDFRFE